MQLLKKLRGWDAHPKPLEDYNERTLEGGLVSIVTYVVIAGLIFSETLDFLEDNVSEQLFVDTSRSPTLTINLDITVPKVACNYLTLDTADTSGAQHLTIKDSIAKQRLDLNQKPILETNTQAVVVTDKSVAEGNSTSCGSCYGAESRPGQCCNTCDQVQEAYREKRWKLPDPSTIEQCKQENYVSHLDAVFKEGCQVYGFITVNRVGGSFHIAPGKSFSVDHVHVHDVQPFSGSDFNMTHTINHLSFGQAVRNAVVSPMDGTTVLAEKGATMFQYYIKVVPTAYEKLDRSLVHTNQFSVTKHQRSISVGDSAMPGIFFQYELSPLMVKYSEKERSIGHYLTSLCVIVGGVYTVAGLVNALLYRSIRLIKMKQQLGKFS